MRLRRFTARSRVAAPAERVFEWHMRPGALERLTPPWEPVEILERSGPVAEGSRVVLRVRAGPFRRRWVAVHRGVEPGREFRDVQVSGPFRRWVHTHRFLPESGSSSWLEDEIEYALPLGLVGDGLGNRYTRRKLGRVFAYRHAIAAADIERHGGVPLRHPLRVAVSGASGLVGSALVPFLTAGGHRVVRLVRRQAAVVDDEAGWDPAGRRIDLARLEGVDAVVHLAGENVASGRWTASRRERIRDSRIEGTRFLSESLARLSSPPKVLVSASAIGYYGSRGGEALDESSGPGTGFLADVCRAWEAAAEPAERAGIRVVRLRIGVVLSARGGALGRMLPLFRLGLGGRIGDGRQHVSWISLDDLVGAIHHALVTATLSGPVNATAPAPVTNAELTRALARTLRRPALVPAPATLLRLALGEMADEVLLSSARVLPRRLGSSGFRFRHPDLESSLHFELGKRGQV